MTWFASIKDMSHRFRQYEKPKYPFGSAVAKQFVEEEIDLSEGEHLVVVQEAENEGDALAFRGPVEIFKVSVIRQVYVRRE